MRALLDCLQAHGELVLGKDGYSEQERRNYWQCGATIDRYLRPLRASVKQKGVINNQDWRFAS